MRYAACTHHKPESKNRHHRFIRCSDDKWPHTLLQHRANIQAQPDAGESEKTTPSHDRLPGPRNRAIAGSVYEFASYLLRLSVEGKSPSGVDGL